MIQTLNEILDKEPHNFALRLALSDAYLEAGNELCSLYYVWTVAVIFAPRYLVGGQFFQANPITSPVSHRLDEFSSLATSVREHSRSQLECGLLLPFIKTLDWPLTERLYTQSVFVPDHALVFQARELLEAKLGRVRALEPWRKVFRDALGPMLSTPGLEALQGGLLANDPALIQGATCSPPPVLAVQDWPVEAADAIGYAYWKGDGLNTVAEIDEAFAKTCFEIDKILNKPAGCRWWINHWDERDRQTLFSEVLLEVSRELARRS